MNTPPIPDPHSPPESNRQINSHELREWLGITPADFLTYAALLGAGSLYFIKGLIFEIIISCICLILGFASCYFGMRHDEKISKAANIAKKIGYPVCFLFLLVLIYLNFTQWNTP